MRALSTYGGREWLSLKPAIHRIKYLRNRMVSRSFSRQGSVARDAFLAAHPEAHGANLAITIAFNTPWAIALWIRSLRANLPDFFPIVVDNSSDASARAEIAALCRAAGTAYIGLPPNPEWSPNRSHGISLNWAYQNLVKPLAPRVFAFLDHDIFPMAPFDLAAAVATQPAYGDLFESRFEGAWSLWAGYCVFDYAATLPYGLDFNYESPLALDTGGENWARLYRHLDRSTFHWPRRSTISAPSAAGEMVFDVLDTFIHYSAASYLVPVDPEARRRFIAGLVDGASNPGGPQRRPG